MSLNVFAAVLLVVGGLVHAIPQVSLMLSGLFGGTPVLQIIVGVASVITGIMLFRK